MSFMLALPKISLHGAGAIGDMVNLVANKQWGKALIVTDGQPGETWPARQFVFRARRPSDIVSPVR